MQNIIVDIYHQRTVDEILGIDGFHEKRIREIRDALPAAVVNVIDRGVEWESPDGNLGFLRDSRGILKAAVDLSYPFFNLKTIPEGLRRFRETEATYLVTHAPSGAAVPALIITEGFDDFELAKHDCFPFMITEKEAVRLSSADDLPKYYEYLGKESFYYSTEEQMKQAIKYKDNLGDYWGKDVTHDPILSRSSRDVPQRIETLLSIPTGKRCLDVGCSCGIITTKLAENGKIITGVEIVPHLFEEAEQLRNYLPAEIQKNISFINSPIEECEFEPESFDAVYMTETFEHIPHSIHKNLIEKILAFLKRNGSVVFSVPNRYPAKKYVEEGRHRWDWFNHVTHYTAKSVEYFLKTYFKNISFHPIYDEPVKEGIFLICRAWEKK